MAVTPVYGQLGTVDDDVTFSGGISVTSNVSGSRFLGDIGTKTLPTFSFTTDADSGLYSNGSGALMVSLNNANDMQFTLSRVINYTNRFSDSCSADVIQFNAARSVVRLNTGTVPTSTTDTASGAELVFDSTNAYFASAANTWARVALTSF